MKNALKNGIQTIFCNQLQTGMIEYTPFGAPVQNIFFFACSQIININSFLSQLHILFLFLEKEKIACKKLWTSIVKQHIVSFDKKWPKTETNLILIMKWPSFVVGVGNLGSNSEYDIGPSFFIYHTHVLVSDKDIDLVLIHNGIYIKVWKISPA